jgi:hypothetical protein
MKQSKEKCLTCVYIRDSPRGWYCEKYHERIESLLWRNYGMVLDQCYSKLEESK